MHTSIEMRKHQLAPERPENLPEPYSTRRQTVPRTRLMRGERRTGSAWATETADSATGNASGQPYISQAMARK